MKNAGTLNIKEILDIFSKTVRKNANYVADMYLHKDVSIISKWKNNKVIPKAEDIENIITFVMTETSEAQRIMIRHRVEDAVFNSELKDEVKTSILNVKDFPSFIRETLCATSTACDEKRQYDSRVKAFKTKETKVDENINSGTLDIELKNKVVGEVCGSIEGSYSGIVEFDMVLVKNKDNNDKKTAKETSVKDIRAQECQEESNLRRLRRFLRARTVLGLIVLAFLSVIAAAQLTNSPVIDTTKKSERLIAVPKVEDDKEKTQPTVSLKPESETKNVAENAPEKTTANDKTEAPAVKEPEVKREDSSTGTEKAEQNTSSKKNDGKNNAQTKSITTNNNSTNNNTTNNNTSNVEGDNNIIVQGNNNTISITKNE